MRIQEFGITGNKSWGIQGNGVCSGYGSSNSGSPEVLENGARLQEHISGGLQVWGKIIRNCRAARNGRAKLRSRAEV